jgi:hypothetical protein
MYHERDLGYRSAGRKERACPAQTLEAARDLGLGEWGETEEGQRCLMELVGLPHIILNQGNRRIGARCSKASR